MTVICKGGGAPQGQRPRRAGSQGPGSWEIPLWAEKLGEGAASVRTPGLRHPGEWGPARTPASAEPLPCLWEPLFVGSSPATWFLKTPFVVWKKASISSCSVSELGFMSPFWGYLRSLCPSQLPGLGPHRSPLPSLAGPSAWGEGAPLSSGCRLRTPCSGLVTSSSAKGICPRTAERSGQLPGVLGRPPPPPRTPRCLSSRSPH